MQVMILAVLSAPILVLFSPLFLITTRVSKEKAAEALAGSMVKISGKDVVTTWKLLTSLVVAPLLWFFYSFLAFWIYYVKYDYALGLKAGWLTTLIIPILGVASIGLSDIAVDLLKSVRPLIVSIGNVMSSSEPLREMRAELQKKIRHLVDELGPDLFPDFENIRIMNHSRENYNRKAADKLGRGIEFESGHFVEKLETSMVNTLFEREIERFNF
jgi:glycerol-3-phosphate O-acyltransferase/dihydroxyacetone phosphate acyltransferase